MTPPPDYRRRLGHIAIQTRAHPDLQWSTVDRTDNPREAAGRSQGLALHHHYVRVVDRKGHVRIEYAHGERIITAGEEPVDDETYRERQTRLAKMADEERARLDRLRARPAPAPVRTVIADGREFESVWDGKGPLPGTRLAGEW
jgi:hypothetical protein